MKQFILENNIHRYYSGLKSFPVFDDDGNVIPEEKIVTR